jgi:predicted ATP-dependent endonuclease of OLD family
MLKSLKIENFRCFPSFELNKLGRINLLVGKNNSGKTTVLEAIQLLYCQNDLKVFWEIMKERKEFLPDEKNTQLDVRNLFFGHQLNIYNQFSILGESRINCSDHQKVTGRLLRQRDSFNQIQLTIEWSNQDNENKDIILPLSERGGLKINSSQVSSKIRNNSEGLTQFVGASLFNKKKLKDLFETIVLTPDENIVMQALKNIEPNIMRIAPGRSGNQGSFYVQLIGDDQRFPIGNMGDGVSRILGIFLAIVNSKDGILLVDEVDTGLHFTTMYDMWKLIYETAKKLNVQVFATTHSRDCWESLAEIAEAEDSGENDIFIHRIEREKSKSIIFTQNQIVIAAEENIEVR